MKPGGFTEISGVCCHPAHRGNGPASGLIQLLALRIGGQGETAFLNSYARNTSALALYEWCRKTLVNRTPAEVRRGAGRRARRGGSRRVQLPSPAWVPADPRRVCCSDQLSPPPIADIVRVRFRHLPRLSYDALSGGVGQDRFAPGAEVGATANIGCSLLSVRLSRYALRDCPVSPISSPEADGANAREAGLESRPSHLAAIEPTLTRD
jgi:hypothetical protein